MKRFFLLMLILCLMPLHTLAGDPSVRCYAVNPNGNTVPVYKKASTKSAKVGDFYVHQPMVWDCWEDDDADGWVKLTEPDVGYIQTKYLTEEPYSGRNPYAGSDCVPVFTAGDGVPLLDAASSTADSTALPGGLRLLTLGDCGQYYYVQVQYASLSGFVRKEDVQATEDFCSVTKDGPRDVKTRIYHADGLDFVPAYTDCSRSRAHNSAQNSVFVFQLLEDWALTNYGFIETRFLDENGDHSLPTAYTSTSDEASRLLLRWKPEKSTDYAGKYFSGVPVTILAQSGDYTQVAIGSRYTNWFATQYLTDTQVDRTVQASVTQLFEESFHGHPGGVHFIPGKEVTLIGSTKHEMITLYNNKLLFIPLEFLMPVDGSGVLEAKTTVRLKMHASITNQDGNQTTLIPKGKKVTVLLHGDEYSKIEYQDEIGYVKTNYLKFQ